MTPSILIVDDEQSLREMLEILLAREGYKVVTAAGGLDALELFRKNPFSVVLADIRMIRIMAQEELAAQRKFTDAARLRTMSMAIQDGYEKPEVKRKRQTAYIK